LIIGIRPGASYINYKFIHFKWNYYYYFIHLLSYCSYEVFCTYTPLQMPIKFKSDALCVYGLFYLPVHVNILNSANPQVNIYELWLNWLFHYWGIDGKFVSIFYHYLRFVVTLNIIWEMVFCANFFTCNLHQ